MSTFFSPEGNPEVWDDMPQGYFTPEQWAEAHPEPVVEPSPEQIRDAKINELKFKLWGLDQEYLTQRILAGAARGDAYALAKIAEHEALAAPIRQELSNL
ncbi:MAG: hypothetical protein LBO66_07775 [Deltaproteobacteria bacterium]|jgi:hypothetical protein|nr:hypothetical protein [Deltaproteobacteria bacterium]